MTDAYTCLPQDRKIPGFLLNNVIRRIFTPPERFLRRYLREGDTAADLGCGSGYYSIPMARIVGEEGRVHAIDFDPRAIEQLEHKADRAGVARIVEARAFSVSDIDFIESGSVDFVLAEGLLCCMKDHEGAVGQILRILKSDGRAYISVMKFSYRNDPRGVSPDEWSRIIARFKVLEGGESLVGRWALLGAGDRATESLRGPSFATAGRGAFSGVCRC